MSAGCHSSVARALAAKARCPGFISRRHHFLSSPMLFQRSTDSNDASCVLSMRCQEVFRCCPFPSCLSSDVATFQWPIAVFTQISSCSCSSRCNNPVVSIDGVIFYFTTYIPCIYTNAVVCSNPCQNGGTCTAPDTCTCVVGWTGTECETGVCTLRTFDEGFT